MSGESAFTTWSVRLRDELRGLGLADAEIVSVSGDERSFGDAEAVIQAGPMIFRFVRDRGQEFLDVASTMEPTVFFQFADLEIAMGWKTIPGTLALIQPEPLSAVLLQLAEHRGELDEAFGREHSGATRRRVEAAASERGQAFAARLRARE